MRRLGPGAGALGLLALIAAAAAFGRPAARPAPVAAAGPLLFADPAFERVWGRTDFLVASGQVARSWFWGPAPGASVVEPYDEGVGRVHLVQYFDKSRMEINNPDADPNSPWYVTNGLLTVELVSGRVQFGNTRWVPRGGGPAQIPLASDLGDHNAPTYASFSNLANTPLGNHPAPDRTGQAVVEGITRPGQVVPAPQDAGYGVRYQHFEPATDHNVPDVFWDFLTSRGPVRADGLTVNQTLSNPWFFTSGFPISEAYWARVQIGGAPHDVLIQCYERRVLTYIPDYAPAWRVQMGNIGTHYVQWRYPTGLPSPAPTVLPTVAP